MAAQVATIWLLYGLLCPEVAYRDGPKVVNTVLGRPSMVAVDASVSANEQRGQTFSCVNYCNTQPHAVTSPLDNLVLVHMHFTVNHPVQIVHSQDCHFLFRTVPVAE